MKHDVGEHVLVKDLKWYHDHESDGGSFYCGTLYFSRDMKKYLGKVFVIIAKDAKEQDYILNCDEHRNWYFNDYMLEDRI